MSIQPDAIREIRRRLGLSQTDLAGRLGLTRDAVASWEIGRSKPHPSAELLLRQLQGLSELKPEKNPEKIPEEPLTPKA